MGALYRRQKNMSDTHQFRGDDAEMNSAIEEARRRLPELRRLLDEDARRLIPTIEGALVKARFQSPITLKIEHMWIEDARFEEDKIVGTLASDPIDLPDLSKGERVSVSPADVTDWICRQGGRTMGGFTVRVMQRRVLDP
ncbi:MAG: DUF2314 domain-containing protein [Verrucomicrobiales bacterium]